MKIIFFDNNKINIDKYENVLDVINQNNNINLLHSKNEIKLEFVHSELSYLVCDNKFDIIISPANSYGHMTGGINKDICKIDPFIQDKVSHVISKSIFFDMDNEPFIPVGTCVPVKINKDFSILIAPTMKHPKDITGTNNVFLAFNAILISLKTLSYQNKDLVIACSCLGTGIGGMDPEKSAKQILHAFLIHQII
jgi:O-acetyl-ADP-ribose deacetylase (regulator of RNase III)